MGKGLKGLQVLRWVHLPFFHPLISLPFSIRSPPLLPNSAFSTLFFPFLLIIDLFFLLLSPFSFFSSPLLFFSRHPAPPSISPLTCCLQFSFFIPLFRLFISPEPILPRSFSTWLLILLTAPPHSLSLLASFVLYSMPSILSSFFIFAFVLQIRSVSYTFPLLSFSCLSYSHLAFLPCLPYSLFLPLSSPPPRLLFLPSLLRTPFYLPPHVRPRYRSSIPLSYLSARVS